MCIRDRGKVAFVVGDDVSTDVIYPGRYMATVLPTETPQYAFANDPALNNKLNAKLVPPGSVLVGGKNFGLSLIHISQPPRPYSPSHAFFCLTKKQ